LGEITDGARNPRLATIGHASRTTLDTLRKALDAFARLDAGTNIAAATTIDPADRTTRPPRRSTIRPTRGARVPEMKSPAVKAPNRKTSETPTSARIAGPRTPIA